jgi:NAD(P)H-dependent FMN reductase
MSGDASGQSGESEPTTARLVVVSAGIEEPSSSRLLADRIANSCVGLLRELRWDASVRVIELAPLAVDVARASVTGLSSSDLQSAIDRVGGADAIIASTPVYKAGLSGLFSASGSGVRRPSWLRSSPPGSSSGSPISRGLVINMSSLETRLARSRRPRTSTSTRR